MITINKIARHDPLAALKSTSYLYHNSLIEIKYTIYHTLWDFQKPVKLAILGTYINSHQIITHLQKMSVDTLTYTINTF